MPEQNFVASYHEPRLQLSVHTLVDKNAAVAKVVFDHREYGSETSSILTFIETGSSKRAKGDPFDWDLGEQFAIARALVKLGQLLLKDADKKVTRLTPAAPAQDVPAEEVFVLDHARGHSGVSSFWLSAGAGGGGGA